MPSAWSTVLEIAGIGSVQLFGYLTGLVALMYLLTSPVLVELLEPTSAEGNEPPEREASGVERAASAETDRRRRAVALAVTTACASLGRQPVPPDRGSSWRVVQRARRLSQPARRDRGRS